MKRLLELPQTGILLLLLILVLGLAYYYAEKQETLMEPASNALTPDFSLPDLDGDDWQLSQHTGQLLLINFWATWCAPCREEMPALERLHQQMKHKGFQVIGIHSGPSADMDQFLAETPISFTILMDKNLELSNWNIPALPATFLIDQDGRAIYWALGPREWDSAQALGFFTSQLE